MEFFFHSGCSFSTRIHACYPSDTFVTTKENVLTYFFIKTDSCLTTLEHTHTVFFLKFFAGRESDFELFSRDLRPEIIFSGEGLIPEAGRDGLISFKMNFSCGIRFSLQKIQDLKGIIGRKTRGI